MAACSAWKRKEEHTQPQEGGRASSLQPDADAMRSGTSNFPRAETAPVAMQLSDDRQSRDECLHGRTQLWASATRQLMPQEDAYVNRRHHKTHDVIHAVDSIAEERLERATQDRSVHTDSAREAGESSPRGSPRSRRVR